MLSIFLKLAGSSPRRFGKADAGNLNIHFPMNIQYNCIVF